MKFGKKRNESSPHGLLPRRVERRAAARRGRCRARPTAPNRPLRSFCSIGFTMLEVLRRRHAAPRRHHAVRTVELVGERLVAVARRASRDSSATDCFACKIGCVVELGERVDEELPVAADLGAVLVHLRQLVERVALEALAELAEVLAQRRGVRGVEVHEDEPLPHVDLHRREAVVGLVEVEELRLLLHEGAARPRGCSASRGTCTVNCRQVPLVSSRG